ncbi:MAG: hypothetical protein LPK00_10340 [Bacillaceae bacterium]|nr:hypothetical protein [Bacillaceae bacterium]
MITLLTIGSLLLGLLACALPAISFMRYQTGGNKHWVLFSIISATACAMALFSEMLYFQHLVRIEDFGAIMDITDGIVLAATILLIFTSVLNAVTVFIYRNKSLK